MKDATRNVIRGAKEEDFFSNAYVSQQGGYPCIHTPLTSGNGRRLSRLLTFSTLGAGSGIALANANADETRRVLLKRSRRRWPLSPIRQAL